VSAAVTIAPASERTLDAPAYLLGTVELALVVVPLAWAAYRLRLLALPRWDGAPGRLIELVLVIAALIWLSELLGSFGAFGLWELVAASLALAALVTLVGPRLPWGVGARTAPPAPPSNGVATVLAVTVCAAVTAGWMVPTLGSLAAGMDRADTLWYHMPLSARFVQTGSLDQIFYFDPIFFASFYPANSEVLHAVPILAFDRDIVSPVLNLGLLAMGLLASWCIGRPYGLGPQALLGGAVALGAQMLVEFQAGESLNDITGVSFVLAAAAILVNGHAARRTEPVTVTGELTEPPEPITGRLIAGVPLAIAGIAAGLAAGTKLSFLAPVAALTLGVIAIAPAGRRLPVAAIWTLPMLAAGAYWYARNFAAVGNPIPFVHSIGPIELPAPDRSFELRPGLSVAHYWDEPTVWKDWFVPGLDESFGELWPATLLATLGGAAYAVWRGREPVLRMLGAMVLFTAVAYLFTPLTAGGEEGEPIAFVWNVRYIAPAVAVGLAILPCLPALRASERRRNLVTWGLALLLAVTVGSLVQWEQGHLKGAIGASVAVLAGFWLAHWLRSRGALGPAGRRRWKLALGVAAALAVVVVGFLGQRHYLERRYENTSPQLKLAEALRWARDVRDARIAISGVRGVFNQYPFYGTDLSNHVQWLGYRGEHEAWLRIPDCEHWRQTIDEGEYDFVVTTYDPFNPGRLTNTKEAVWTRRDPATREILHDGPVRIYEVTGPLDPSTCDGLPRLSPAELDGESVNAKPLANQPPGTGPREG
jgi:hypothetical protein